MTRQILWYGGLQRPRDVGRVALEGAEGGARPINYIVEAGASRPRRRTGTAPWSSTSKKRYENREWPRGNPKVAFVNNSEYGKSALSGTQHATPSSASSQSRGGTRLYHTRLDRWS